MIKVISINFYRSVLRIALISYSNHDGVVKLLKDLHNEGIKVGIIIDELGGVQFRKPCDIAFRIMQTRWKLPASQMVYVGDNPAKDFQAPQQLGMKSVYFKNRDGLYFDFRQNHAPLKSLQEILRNSL